MSKITNKLITKTVARLCVEANYYLRPDVKAALIKAERVEASKQAKDILNQLIENAEIASKERIPICQDTGLPVVFVEIGKNAKISGLDLSASINKGVDEGYKKGYLRNSIIADPLKRGVSKFSPCVIHYDFAAGSSLKITVLPKGFGSENKTKLCMLNPTSSMDEIKNFILNSVKEAGPDACPPYVIGVGIGGTADYACLLAKKALLKPIKFMDDSPSSIVHRLKRDLFREINKFGIGPMGLGGRITCLGVNIMTYPTHIAGLPVCVNISCHVLRSASALL